MPYPPPASPPTLSIFQAIGKVPEIPDPTGNAGKFLETDGAITVWSPVSGGGGVVASIGPVAGPYAFGAAITGVDNNVLQLGAADASNPGVTTTALQSLSGLKNFRDGASTSIYDARLRGAIARLQNTAGVVAAEDVAPFFYDTLASWSKDLATASAGFPTAWGTGGIEFPEGAFQTSMPLCVPGPAIIRGKGWLNTFISPGYGTPATPTLVQGFCGPLMYCATPYLGTVSPTSNFPLYQSALVTGPGQSIVIDPSFTFGTRNNNQWPLHDAPDWIKFGLVQETAFALQCFFQPQTGPVISTNYEGTIIGSCGPNNVWTNPGDHTDRAFGISLVSTDGVHTQFRAFLTTNPLWAGPFEMQSSGQLHTITSSNVTLGNTYNLEISYDGSFFNFYVDGVLQGHVGATGPIVQAPWEGVFIGGGGPDFTDGSGDIGILSCKGALYSLRLSNIARHTGAGNFTPPTTAYSWDSSTCALYNFDIPDKTYQPVDYAGNPAGDVVTLPFVVGQARCATSFGVLGQVAFDGPVNHYIRTSGASLCQGAIVKDIFLNCNSSVCGLMSSAAPETLWERVYVNNPSSFGFRVGTAVSFYANLQDCRVSGAIGTGFQYIGDGLRLQTQSCGIGLQCNSGSAYSVNNQPTYSGWAAMLFGPGASQSQISVKNCTVDLEFWHYRRTRAMTVVYGQSISTLAFENNGLNAQLTEVPPVMFCGPFPSNDVLSLEDAFYANAPNPSVPNLDGSPFSVAIKYNNSYPGKFLLTNPLILDQNNPKLAYSNIPGFVSVIKPGQQTAWTGISLSDVRANNLAGTFTIRAAFTEGGPEFNVAEPDGNYQVTITAMSALGGVPAANSTVIRSVVTRANGFTATIAAAPGGSVEITFAYQLTRVFAPPLLLEYVPAIPSNFPNPLAGTVAAETDWYVGLVAVPVSGNLIAYDQSISARQALVESGNTPGTDWWALYLGGQIGSLDWDVGASSAQQFAAVAQAGKLACIHSPGAHFLGMGLQGATLYTNLDGITTRVGPYISGAQGSTIYVGELFDTTLPLASATIRNLKFGPILEAVLSNDNDIGPGSQNQALILGDEVSYGASSAAGDGGYAGQIQTLKYGTTFYHSGTMLNATWTASLATTGIPGLAIDLWGQFQGLFADAPQLECLIMFAGMHDILLNKTAANTFAQIVGVVEGQFASATWQPSTSFLTPTDQRAFAVITGARGPGTSNYVINGTSIASVWNTDSHQTCIDTAATIAASALNTDWVCVLQNNPVGSSVWGIIIYWRDPGTVGNGKVFTCDGAAGGFCFGDVGDNVPSTGLTVASFNGLDSSIRLGGVTFVSNFDTDAATTVNNMVSLINADPTVSPLVTASNVANECFIITNNRGLAGSDITITAFDVNGSTVKNFRNFVPLGVLQGGEDGAITKGIGTILICNIPPNDALTGPQETQRVALNVLINAYTGTGVTIVDVETTLWNPANHLQLNPAYGTGYSINATGHTALYGLIQPLIP
jgi:hypothetical protein